MLQKSKPLLLRLLISLLTGQHCTSNELCNQGIFISNSEVRSIWLGNKLENVKKCLKFLAVKPTKDGFILSDAQVSALEKKSEDIDYGEIKTAHTGALESQSTLYIVNLKGVCGIYQKTFEDTYRQVAFCKFYTTKMPITSADVFKSLRVIFAVCCENG